MSRRVGARPPSLSAAAYVDSFASPYAHRDTSSSICIQVSVHFGFQELTSTNLSSRLESGEGWKGGEGGREAQRPRWAARDDVQVAR